MNMPPPGGQPPAGGPPPQGQPGGQPQGQNPIVQCIQILGQFVERLAQRNPAAGKAAAQHLQGLIQAIKGASGGPGEAKEGPQPPEEEASESPAEAKQEAKPQGKKKMGPMPMNAKPGAQQVL